MIVAILYYRTEWMVACAARDGLTLTEDGHVEKAFQKGERRRRPH